MPCHPHTVPQRLRPFIHTPTSVANLDNPRQRRTNPYGYPEYLRRPFDESRGPSRTFEDLRGPSGTFAVLPSPSIPPEILRDPSRRFDPSSIPFETVRSLVDPLRRSSRVYRAFAEA